MSKYKDPCICDCGESMERDFHLEHTRGGVDCMNQDYEFEGPNGTRLYAASYLPNQIEDAKKKHPGREFKLKNGCYLPVIKNRGDKLRYLKEYGNYEEYD